MALNDDLLDKLIEGYQKPEDLIGENGLLKQLTKKLIERAMSSAPKWRTPCQRKAGAAATRGTARVERS